MCKKILCILLAAVMAAAVLAGCGRDNVDDELAYITERNIEIATQILAITDEFLDGYINPMAALERIRVLDPIYITGEIESEMCEILENRIRVLHLALDTAVLDTQMIGYTSDMSRIFVSRFRNYLAETLGVESR